MHALGAFAATLEICGDVAEKITVCKSLKNLSFSIPYFKFVNTFFRA
jgi:hypothetical protein